MKIPKKLLTTKYRRDMWDESQKILKKIEKILPVSQVYLMGSFTTNKKRPADVDCMLLVKTPVGKRKQWSIDFVIAPDNDHGTYIVEDARLWMQEKYGEGNFEYLRLR